MYPHNISAYRIPTDSKGVSEKLDWVYNKYWGEVYLGMGAAYVGLRGVGVE